MKLLGKIVAFLFGLLFKEWKKPHEGEMAGGDSDVRNDVNDSVDDMLDDDTKLVRRVVRPPGWGQ
jgi:hypothetical protein